MSERASDKRRFPRYAVELQARVQLAGASLDTVTRDIGQGGICVIGPRQVAPGSTLELSLDLILGSSVFSESLDLCARVIWCTPWHEMFQLGAVFTELTPAKVGQLEMFLRFLQQEILLDETEPLDEDEKFDTGDIDD